MSKILVLDDDIDILDILGILLKRNNYTVLTISEWELLASSIDSFSPDLILLDIALNGADGRDLCKKLKNAKETRYIPVILFSAHYNEERALEESMADAFVKKPFNVSYLLDTIHKNIA